MAQHDYNIANQSGLEFRADLNNVLQAIVTNNSGPSEPTTMFAGMEWVDTSVSPSIKKKGNDSNTAWIVVSTTAGEALSGASTAADQRIALGLGTAAVLNVGTSANNIVQLDSSAKLPAVDGSQLLNISSANRGYFYKVDPNTPVFNKTGAGTAEIKAGTKVEVSGTTVSFASATSITMPTLVAGTDYAVWVKDDSTIQASTNFSSPPGAGNWRKIGGFHYAPGGNASAQAGGDTTPAINQYSFWDLKFKPACTDPRGMTLVADSFWADIYFLGVDHLTNGTSKYNVTIADGGSPPKIPTKFGGNGSTSYSTFNWWEANEVLRSWGKRSPTYDEFAALAYGTTEATASGGSDVPTTGVNGTGATNSWNKFTSKWGVIQSTGCLYIFSGVHGGGSGSAGWSANTGGRGSTYQLENVGHFGGYYTNSVESGSRCSIWANPPTYSSAAVSARGVCNHIIIE